MLKIASIAALACSIPAMAGVLYTDRTAFLAAAGSPATNIDFEGLASAGGTADYSTSSGLSLSGVNFVGTQTTCSFVLSVPANPPNCSPSVNDLSVSNPTGNPWGSGAYLVLPSSSNSGASRSQTIVSGELTISLPANVFAFGTDAMSPLITGSSATLTLSDGTSYVVSFGNFAGMLSNPPVRQFFGIVSSVAITSATLDIAAGPSAFVGSQSFLDNFVYTTNAAASTPEPASFALISGALCLIGARLRRR